MKIFLAGAAGVIGRRLAVLAQRDHHEVTATTRSPAKVEMLRALRTTPVVIDVFDADALTKAVVAAGPDIVIHQLTDLPSAPGTPGYQAAQAARQAGVRRAVAQSIAFIYAPAAGVRVESDPLDLAAEGVRRQTVEGIVALERAVLNTSGIDGVVLRYGYLYGPDTWYERPPKPPSVHVDAAAQAALLAITKGAGSYNIAEDDGAVSSEKARRELGFDAGFRMASEPHRS